MEKVCSTPLTTWDLHRVLQFLGRFSFFLHLIIDLLFLLGVHLVSGPFHVLPGACHSERPSRKKGTKEKLTKAIFSRRKFLGRVENLEIFSIVKRRAPATRGIEPTDQWSIGIEISLRNERFSEAESFSVSAEGTYEASGVVVATFPAIHLRVE